jgi:AcrR family transcriptional regulator
MVERREETDRVVEILDAACRVIARDGWAGLRMDAVARQAGVSKALVHYYFSTRKELLRAAFGRSEDIANAGVEAELAGVDDPRARLEQYLLLVLDERPLFAENRALWSEVWSGIRLNAEIRPDVEGRYTFWIDRLAELIDENRDENPAAGSAETRNAAWQLAASLDGIEGLMLLGLVSHGTAASLVRQSVAATLETVADPSWEAGVGVGTA